MNNLFDLIDKYKFGIISAFAVYIGIFMYLELTSVEQYFEIESFNGEIKKKNDEVVIKQEEYIEAPLFEQGKVSNALRDVNDTRTRSNEDWSATKSSNSSINTAAESSNSSHYSSSQDVEKMIKEEERKMFAETGGEEKRKAIKMMDEERKKNQKENSSLSSTKSNANSTGASNAIKGNVMVEWSLSNRNPHQNNDWNIRNPGYTCGRGAAGRVVISIKVGQDGRVLSAVCDQAASTSANSCMIEQALKYAKLSRFDYSPSESSQSGKIYYTFVSQ